MAEYYGVFKETWDNSHMKVADEHAHNIIAILDEGIGGGCLFRSHAYENKDDAGFAAAEQRMYAREEREHQRYGYCSYRDHIFVHEVDAKGHYLPSAGDIKKVMEYMNTWLIKDAGRASYGDFAYDLFLKAYGDMTPAKIRKELIENGKLLRRAECSYKKD